MAAPGHVKEKSAEETKTAGAVKMASQRKEITLDIAELRACVLAKILLKVLIWYLVFKARL